MKISQITYKDLHDPIYGGLDNHPDIKAKLESPPEFIRDMIGYSRRNSFMERLGLRVAAISAGYLEVITAYEKQEQLVQELGHHGMDNVLDRMKSCYPGGAEVDLTNRYYCDKYAACPWCRFRQAVEIERKLEGHLKHSGGLAVIRISQPAPFEYVSEDLHQDYSTLIRGLCVRKKPKPFLYDAVVTVPNWYQSYFHQDGQHTGNKEWVFSRDTSIIGILPKGGGDLPLPENCVSEAARENMAFCGASSWRVYTPTKKNLRFALGYAMRFSPGLLSPNLDPAQYIDCITMQENYRTTYHGFERGG